MGWEYVITLKNKEYKNAVEALHNSFLERNLPYKIYRDEKGFALLSDEVEWPELFELSIHTAKDIDFVLPDGEEYIYCLFYIGRSEAFDYLETIKRTFETLKYEYFMEDL